MSDERPGTWLWVSRPTLHRRNQAGRLSPEESDPLMRYARLCRRASLVLVSDESARSWLLASTAACAGECPLDYVNTELGVRQVEDLLSRLVLRLPSVVLPEESVLLLNLRNPDMSKISVSDPKPSALMAAL